MKAINGKEFFERYPSFLTSSPNGHYKHRLSDRYDAIFGSRQVEFLGKSVLDLAAHDGRWSWAARLLGADHVTAVEANPRHSKAFKENMNGIAQDSSWYTLEERDIVNYLRTNEKQFDVVLCLGWFYHTVYQVEVVQNLSRITRETLILDTECIPDPVEAFFKLRRNRNHSMSSYTESFTQVPSLASIRLLLSSNGFSYTEYDWTNNITAHEECPDYAGARRITLFCSNVNFARTL